MITTHSTLIEPDIAIIGGGIAGLWLTKRLSDLGYTCALFEKRALGSEQTVASQGMIHGGIKYTLAGSLTGASESIADMPAYWQACMEGKGEVDLSGAKVLSDSFYFWSSGSVSSRMTTFFASKAVRGRVNRLAKDEYPELLKSKHFKGKVYRLQDIVLDVPSILHSLSDSIRDNIFLLPDEHSWSRDDDNRAQLHIAHNAQHPTSQQFTAQQFIVKPQQFIFTAGKGNGELLSKLQIDQPTMQVRPLHQAWLKHSLPYHFYGHCLGADSTPRLSISSHPCADGRIAWSLGGSLAESGVNQTREILIKNSRQELKELFPWLDFSDGEWITSRIDRAEPKQRNFLRPDKAFIQPAEGLKNVMVAWPTKLTLTPNLSTETVKLVRELKVNPTQANLSALNVLAKPSIATPPWDDVTNLEK